MKVNHKNLQILHQSTERTLYMKFPFFASFIIFIIWLAYEMRKADKIHKKRTLSFWERESESNNTRRKSLDLLDYVKIPLERLPVHILENDVTVISCLDTLRRLQNTKIVNLTGYSNTDLKMQYGVANLNDLTEYDQNFTELVTTLQTCAKVLYDADYITETATILEYAVNIHSDVSASYLLLAKIYDKTGQTDKITSLIEAASGLNSLSKNIIVRTLQESYPYTG